MARARARPAQSAIFSDCRFRHQATGEIKAGRVTAAILLSNDCTDTAWFHEAAGLCSAMCFPRGRIRFEREDGPADSPPQGQVFFYFGNDIATFRGAFAAVGLVVVPA